MANRAHLAILNKGTDAWNKLRKENPEIEPDFSKADLSGADLSEVDLSGADLSGANLNLANLGGANLSGADLSGANLNLADISGAHLNWAHLSGAYLYRANLSGSNLSRADFSSWADLCEADLTGADLTGADLTGANLSGSNLSKVNLSRARLTGANLSGANLFDANLSDANLKRAILVETDLKNVKLTNCHIYGISAWNLRGKPKEQQNLIITHEEEATITVDNLEVAQFIYLLLNNQKIRDVIQTIGQKAVLILGRFSPPERKEVLNKIRERVRELGYLPMMFDFEGAKERDFTETIKVLAGLSLFVIVDITNPKSAPLELQATVPDYMIPFVPIIQKGEVPFSMFKDLTKYDWVLKPVREYDTKETLLVMLEKAIIKPAIEKHKELVRLKAKELEVKDILGLSSEE
ncbi:pentapeptide repeat-containing protein [Desulfobacterota bacterium AH_259_B03_O07]|nr:pentapeptide repeat-containing protein [Desulfobacterota bacterium AH_259_B03_O07]